MKLLSVPRLVVNLVKARALAPFNPEKALKCADRAVAIRHSESAAKLKALLMEKIGINNVAKKTSHKA